MGPKKKQASPTNSKSQVSAPIATTPEEWLPKHGFAMRPPIHPPPHTRLSTATLSADKRSISSSSTATLPAPSERSANTSMAQDITHMPQATSARDKDQRKCNISMYEQAIRMKQYFMQERQKVFNRLQEGSNKLQEELNKLQEEFNRAKMEMDGLERDINKAEEDKGMLEKLLQTEKKLKQKEEDYDVVVTMFHNVVAEIPRSSLASPLQGTKRAYPDESQDRSTRKRTETPKD